MLHIEFNIAVQKLLANWKHRFRVKAIFVGFCSNCSFVLQLPGMHDITCCMKEDKVDDVSQAKSQFNAIFNANEVAILIYKGIQNCILVNSEFPTVGKYRPGSPKLRTSILFRTCFLTLALEFSACNLKNPTFKIHIAHILIDLLCDFRAVNLCTFFFISVFWNLQLIIMAYLPRNLQPDDANPPWMNKADNAWQLTSATLVGLQSVPGIRTLTL